MTDSVKLWAFSERLRSEIGALQLQGRAGAGVAPRRSFEAALPPTADLAGPARLGKEVEHVGTAEQPNHLALLHHGDAAYALADQQARGLVDPSLFTDRDHAVAHDVARHLALLGKDIGFGDDA